MDMEAKFAELERKVDRMERIMRRLVEHPVVWQSPGFRSLLIEMGYRFKTDEDGRTELVPPAALSPSGEK